MAAESARHLDAVLADALDSRALDRLGARRVPPENYHVTLKFLGEIDRTAAQAALNAVASLTGRGLAARASGFAGLPSSRASRLVVALLEPHRQLEQWWAELQERLGREDRRFRPHVTLLRLRKPRAVDPLSLAEPLPLGLEAPRLYRSDPGPDGVRYRPIGPERGGAFSAW